LWWIAQQLRHAIGESDVCQITQRGMTAPPLLCDEHKFGAMREAGLGLGAAGNGFPPTVAA
jgi:hypothetical protein